MFGKKKKDEIIVPLTQLPIATEINDLKLVEIKDKKVISRVKSAVPEIAQTMVKTGIALQEIQLANSGIYQALLPSGAKLVNSKEIEGAMRGFFRQGNGIGGQANLMAVDGTVGKIAAANVANAIMGAASLVVGQYYMSQINNQLVDINKTLSKIADFQQNEYKSKVMTLLTQIKRISDFQIEILEDNDLRKEEILRLQSLETTCMELLGQANITIDHLSNYEENVFNKYFKVIDEIAKWQKYQTLLINVLYMIADLNYVLHLGANSKEQCYAAYSTLYDQTNKTVEKVKKWHKLHEKKFGIDIKQAKIKRDGFDAIIHKPLEVINKNYKYRSISTQKVEDILYQKNVKIKDMEVDTRDLYQEDVKLIIKDGKIYYLQV